MNALVTGGAGFIGTNLIKRLLKDGHEVVSIDNYSTGKKENHQKGCSYNNFDISDDYVPYGRLYWPHSTKVMDEVGYPDVIFHLAALPRIQPSFETPIESFKANVVGTINILEWARKNDVKVISAGSSSVHGGAYKNPYTFTKWQSDKLCHMYSEIYKVDVNVCRFYNVYGPYELTEGEYCTVVGIFQKQYENHEPLTITWDGEQRRDFTHVDDIVDGLILTAEGNNWGLTLEFGSGTNHSINELADMFDIPGPDGHFYYDREFIDKRPGEVRSTLCDIGLAYSAVGYQPKRNLEDYINKIK
jgi:UDP-glucose 4-epimerase